MIACSGRTEFKYEIERYKDIITGNFLDKNQVDKLSNNVGLEYTIISLTVDGRYSYQPGVFSAPPEKCYEDEAETEILSVLDEDNKDWLDDLTQSEEDTIKSLIEESVSDQDGDYDFDDEEDF